MHQTQTLGFTSNMNMHLSGETAFLKFSLASAAV